MCTMGALLFIVFIMDTFIYLFFMCLMHLCSLWVCIGFFGSRGGGMCFMKVLSAFVLMKDYVGRGVGEWVNDV